MCKCNEVNIKFAKTREDAIIPTKKEEDAGYDIYACFDEDYIVIRPNEVKLIPTGIASAFPNTHYFQFHERGSTGTKGMSYRAGVIDSGFRNMWQVPINNTSDKIIVICKDSKSFAKDNSRELNYLCNSIGSDIETYMDERYTFYPYTKAIAQAVLLPVPKTNIEEVSYEELLEIESERGLGMLGSSNK